MGPIALLDEVGLDVAQKGSPSCTRAFGERLVPPEPLGRLVGDGRLGRKNGAVSIATTTATRRGVDDSVYPLLGVRPVQDADLTWFSAAGARHAQRGGDGGLDEGVVRSPRDGDVGALFGIGFPAFRGGPLRTIDDFTATRVVDVLRDLQDVHGSRFEPAESLVEMSAHGSRYYPA